MDHPAGPNGSLVLSYLGLRKAVGIIGTALPFVLAFGKILLEGPGIQSSISDYYYTEMRGVFVGSLQRNAVYTVCGYAILACLVLSGLVELMLPDDSPVKRLDPVFWLESAALVAFGISWLTKGEAILKDAVT